jgi:hypothetical protein
MRIKNTPTHIPKKTLLIGIRAVARVLIPLQRLLLQPLLIKTERSLTCCKDAKLAMMYSEDGDKKSIETKGLSSPFVMDF